MKIKRFTIKRNQNVFSIVVTVQFTNGSEKSIAIKSGPAPSALRPAFMQYVKDRESLMIDTQYCLQQQVAS